MELNPLTALSPIDGRYARQTDALRDIFSECAFMNARFMKAHSEKMSRSASVWRA